MQYREFGKLNIKVSALGFGAMRLPLLDDRKTIDEYETEKIIRYCTDKGLNYIDTAAPYHDGNSETVIGKVLENGLRQKVLLATKMPCWLIETYPDFDKHLEEQLKKLRTDYVDFYILHALFTERWEKVYNLDVLGWAEKAIKKGTIRYFGFSFHDNIGVFKKIVDSYDRWDMCQIQLNYMNENFQAGTDGLLYAAGKGIATVIMEPLHGGLLANPPSRIRKLFTDAGKIPADLALRWLWNKPEVTTVLSGMSTFEQTTENIEYAESAGTKKLTDKELKLIETVVKKYEETNPIPCTKCGYCMDCPNGVDIPNNIEVYNETVIFENVDIGRVQYNYHTPDKNKAGACTGCGMCEEKCPQKIPIAEWMPKIHKALVFAS